ncbi:hypothetical protein nACB2_056 [Acinetobacter phage nACB2]|nr:hypothetical protein nACB2_056 [Acinetobacter phage nACB2]
MNGALSITLLVATIIVLLIIESRKQLGRTSNISAWIQTAVCLAVAFIIGRLSL